MKELLKKFYTYYKQDFSKSIQISYGICLAIQDIYSKTETSKLKNYILSKRPKRGKFFDKEYENSTYFWNKQDINIRILWLESLIKRTPKSLKI